jgi:DnaJ-class molecular chaperone
MSLYNDLGVDTDATSTDIKKSFRKLSMTYHPDRESGNEERYKKINHAYQVLSDTVKRKEYDIQQRGMDGSFGHPDIMNMMRGMPFSFSDVHVFHNGVPIFMNNMKPLEHKIQITLVEAYEGVHKNIRIHRDICGQGVMGMMRKKETENVYIPIHEGVDSNEVIVLKEYGHVYNDRKGDLKIRIQVLEHENFIRRGMHLLYKKKITFKESLCGFKFQLEHINGKKFVIQNNDGKVIYDGFRKTLKGLGMKREGRIGDLIIEFTVDYPDTLPEKTIEYLRNVL